MLTSLFRKQLPSRIPCPKPLSSSSSSSSSSRTIPPDPVTLSYLQHTCGLSPPSALAAAKKLRLRSTAGPDAVLQTLAHHGLSRPQIALIFSKSPRLLAVNAAKTLAPKLAFLRSPAAAGLSAPALASLLLANPRILESSLENKIAPSVAFLKTVFPPDFDPSEAVAAVFKHSKLLVTEDHSPNLDVLRRHGVPYATVLKLLVTKPRALVIPAERLDKIVGDVRELGLDPTRAMFAYAVGVMAYSTEATLVRKVELFRSHGWSGDEVFALFRKQPMCLFISPATLRKKMAFFVGKLGWDTAFLLRSPALLMYSIEQRLVPRCSVLKLLMARGAMALNTRGASRFLVSDRAFFDKYVRAFEGEVPEVVEAWEGRTRFDGWVELGIHNGKKGRLVRRKENTNRAD